MTKRTGTMYYLIIAGILLFGQALAQDSLNVSRVGQLSYWDSPAPCTVANGLAYVPTQTTGLRIVDVSNPDSLWEVGFIETPGWARDVVVAGDYAYVADHEEGMRIIEVSNPAEPVEVGYFDSIAITAVSFSGDYVCAKSGRTISVIDVSDPQQPYIVGQFHNNDNYTITDFASQGRFLFLLYGTLGMHIVDLADPTEPVEVGSCEIEGYSRHISVTGDFAYVAVDWEGIRIIDISIVGSPFEVGHVSSAIVGGIDTEGNYAYAIRSGNRLQVIDIEDPHSPQELGEVTVPGYSGGGVEYANGVCYIVNGSLWSVAVLDPDGPTLKDNFGIPNSCRRVAFAGDYAYTCNRLSGLRIIDCSSPENPMEIRYYDTPGSLYDLAISGNYAYLADDNAGLRVVDIADPSAPEEVGAFEMVNGVKVVAAQGDYVYLLDDFLYILDVSDPTQPTSVGTYVPPSVDNDVAVLGDYAYVVGGPLTVVDVSDPTSPIEVGRFDAPFGHAERIAVADHFAYVGYTWYFRIIDVSVPESPAEVGIWFGDVSVGAYVEDLFVQGDYLFVANKEQGVRIVDVSNPALPEEVGFYVTPGGAQGLALSANYLYVADNHYFGVYDFADALSVRNLTLRCDGSDVLLSWDENPSPYFRIYSSPQPVPPFHYFEGTTSQLFYRIVNGLSHEQRYYYVVGSMTE